MSELEPKKTHPLFYTFGKILLSIIATVMIIIGGGFIALIISIGSVSQRFYLPVIAVTCLVLIIYTIIRIFSLLRPKVRNIAFGAYVGLLLISVVGYEANHYYHYKYLTTVTDQEVDLRAYQPFTDNSKAVHINGEASLKLTSDLPRMDGATALYPVYAAFAQAVYPEKDYPIYDSEVMSSKTSHAYERLFKGEADIIFVAGPSRQQLAEAERLGIELKLTPIGREAFVFFVNSRNPVEDLTLEQIQGIYSGSITNWREVGGRNQSIRAFQRPENSGSQTALQRIMEDQVLMTPPKEDVIAGMGGIIKETANYRNYRNAIGYSFRYYSTEMVRDGDIKLLKINGVYPDKESINAETYPITSEFYAITAASDNPHLNRFLEWILSPEGQSLIEKTGYVPLK